MERRRKIIFSGSGMLLIVVLTLLAFSTQGMTDGQSAHQAQIAPEKRLAELRDSLSSCSLGTGQTVGKINLNIKNTTNHNLIVEMSGPSNYRLSIGPNFDQTWVILPGNYRFEAQIPGFPPLAGVTSFSQTSDFCWQFSYKDQ